MKLTGHDMKASYRETSLGGLAVNWKKKIGENQKP
jgi:hypothetical protein